VTVDAGVQRTASGGGSIQEMLAAVFVNPEDAPCPGDGCCGHQLEVSPELLGLLTRLVDDLQRKLVLKYLFKCAEFNARIGGGNPFHAFGLAVDVDTVRTEIPTTELARRAWAVGFNAVGVYGTNETPGYKGKQGMVHLGIETAPRHWGDWPEPRTRA
jgi:hypothetical protein